MMLPPAPRCHPEAAGRGTFRAAVKVPRFARDDTVGWVAALCAILMLLALPALAVEPSEMLKDPALEARARDIGRALRCVVCQNQSIDDSAAEVAHDMRRAVRERLSAGDSDDKVYAFMVARYGDYVLLKPPFKPGTLVLWLGAPRAAAGRWRRAAAGRAPAARCAATPPPLSDEEQRR